MNSYPDFLIPSAGNNRKQIKAASEGYRPLLASWLLELTLTLGWYKKVYASRRWIIESSYRTESS